MATKPLELQIELATKPLELQIELETKRIELETKRIESLEAQTDLEKVKQRYKKEENESLSRNSSLLSFSIHEDHPVVTTTATSGAEIKSTSKLNTKVKLSGKRRTSNLSSNSTDTGSVSSSNEKLSSISQ
jgi:hypothetical protein